VPALAAQGQITEVNPSGIITRTATGFEVEPPTAKGVITEVNPSGVGFAPRGLGKGTTQCPQNPVRRVVVPNGLRLCLTPDTTQRDSS
jgi:hypothetical protein